MSSDAVHTERLACGAWTSPQATKWGRWVPDMVAQFAGRIASSSPHTEDSVDGVEEEQVRAA